MIWHILEARAEIQKYFRSFFGTNEDIQKSFWNYLTFKKPLFDKQFDKKFGSKRWSLGISKLVH